MNTLTNQFREQLCSELQIYAGKHPEQSQTADTMREFITRTPDCFERSHKEGHITGSAWLINPGGDKVLLTLHRKLQRWMQTGGHADGDPEPLRVALREATEESGIEDIRPLYREIFDIDIHRIPGNEAKNEPEHLHYDIRYLLEALHEDFSIADVTDTLVWWSRSDSAQRAAELDASVLRMAARYFRKDESPSGG